MGKVLAVCISDKKGISKNNINQCELIENYGLKGDAHAGDWHRQVSLLSIESINKMKIFETDEEAVGKFAENITTEGIQLYSLEVGTKLIIGQTILEITQIGKECHQKCAIFNKIGDCVMPKEGIFAKVLKGGIIKVGNDIRIEN